MTNDELLELIGGMEVCFWLDEGGKPCPTCGKLHNVIPRPAPGCEEPGSSSGAP
jgi:hypothetical protein